MTDTKAEAGPAESVRPLELFFDLVFVFTITEVASLLVRSPTPLGIGRVTVLLALIWWMYGGYAWLTNALDLDRTAPRLLLLTGTAGFFLMSLTVPKAVGPGPWALVFGVSYLVVVAVHLIGFIGTSGHRGILRVGPLNVVSALVVVAAGAVPQVARLWLWALACAIELSTPLITGVGRFTVGVGHFVERHGLAVIIVLGESITEVGAATASQDKVGTAIVGALLALAVSAAMFWLYFGREERESKGLMERVPANKRPRVAVYAFGYSYFVAVLGIAITAVGMQKSIETFGHGSGNFSGLLLPLGTVLFLVGLACFHRVLSGTWPRAWLWTALAVAVGVSAAALRIGGAAALSCVFLVLLGLIGWEGRRARRA